MFSVRFKQMLSVAALLALAGCGGQGVSAMHSVPPAAHGAVPVPAQILDLTDDSLTTKNVGIRLNGETSFNSPDYGKVLGYFKGKTSTMSQVVKLPAATNVIFNNVDAFSPHTASFLGDATQHNAPWPTSFNGSHTASPAGTAIGTANFSTGVLAAHKASLKYNTGSPGFYMFGCFFHYDSNGMRTVIIVH
ncbi:MAG TPA: hypothetical protein VJN22_01380 [Candidatus Eremiobacteraceae bacterium]|nr:hypothetical protein [Candidatus Eremiobacteraceae bacterium]